MTNKLKVNTEYFKNIDTPEKAYWLGFLYADGGIIYNGTYKNKPPMKISFNLKDKVPVENFKEAVCSEHKLGEYDIYDKRTKKTYKRYGIQVTNQNFTQYVINTGLKGKNYYNTDFPKLKDELIPYFLRGLFDGDGCIANCLGSLRLGFIATESILVKLKNILQSHFSIKDTKFQLVAKNDTGNLYKMWVYNEKDIYNCLTFIYQDSSPKTRLERKYLLAQKIINEYETKEKNKPSFTFKKDGRVITTKDLRSFAKENGLLVQRLNEVWGGKRKHHKGWNRVTF